MNDEFYIGYEDTCPPSLGRHVRTVVIGMTLLAVGMVSLVAVTQGRFDSGTFEFGKQRTFEGVLYELPLPLLRVTESTNVTNYLLVGAGKHGLPAFAQGHDGQKVRFAGSLIEKDGMRMVELNAPESFKVVGEASSQEQRGIRESVGHVKLTGELVDTKCYLGVMRPAVGKVHRACAVRCLSGGVPPGLLVRDADGNGVAVLLTGADGQSLKYDVEWAARLIDVEGSLDWEDELPVLRVARMDLARP